MEGLARTEVMEERAGGEEAMGILVDWEVMEVDLVGPETAEGEEAMVEVQVAQVRRAVREAEGAETEATELPAAAVEVREAVATRVGRAAMVEAREEKARQVAVVEPVAVQAGTARMAETA